LLGVVVAKYPDRMFDGTVKRLGALISRKYFLSIN
jgi:hypothetical protein